MARFSRIELAQKMAETKKYDAMIIITSVLDKTQLA